MVSLQRLKSSMGFAVKYAKTSVSELNGMLRISAQNISRSIPTDRKVLSITLKHYAGTVAEAGIRQFSSDVFTTAKNIIGAGYDYFTLFAPQFKQTKRGTFAFTIHPRDITDTYFPYPFFRYLPATFVHELVKYLPPITVSQIKGLSSFPHKKEVSGHLLSIVLTPQHMIEDPRFVGKRIMQMIMLAKKKGVAIVGLGGLIPSFTKYGTIIKEYVPGIAVTTGHSYTSVAISQITLRIMELTRKEKEPLIAIVGAAGSTGSACASNLANLGIKRLMLVDLPKKQDRMEEINNLLKISHEGIEIETTTELSRIYNADIIITITNSPQAIIKSKWISPGTIIIDDAQPRNVSAEVKKERNRKDILVLEVLARIPGIYTDPNFTFGLHTREDHFTCLAEAAILAIFGFSENFTVGYVKPRDIEEITRMAEMVGVQPYFFFTDGGFVSERELKGIASCKKQSY